MVTLVGLFLIMHGLVHLAVFVPEPGPSVPWVPARPFVPGLSRRPTRVRRLAVVGLAAATMGLFVTAGMAATTGGPWWIPAAVVATGASVVLLAGNFHPLLLSGILLDGAVLVVVAAS